MFAAWIVLLVVLFNYYIKMIELEDLLEREKYSDETMTWMVMILIGGALSLLLFYRPRCKRKWTRITRNVFAVVLLLGTLTAGIATAPKMDRRVDELINLLEEHKKKEAENRVMQSIINDLDTGGDAADVIIWAIHNNRFWEIIRERDSLVQGVDDHNRTKIEDSYKRAVERRAEEGNANAEYIEGEYYYDEWDKRSERSEGTVLNRRTWRVSSKELNEMLEHAFYWWSLSASHGCPHAYTRMAQCYEGIINIPTLYNNRQIAFDWWQKLANAGYSSGYYNMGRMLVEDNYLDEAFRLWEIAKSMGDEDAKNALEQVYSNGVQPGAKKNNPPL